jgi:hypothetical protein
MIEKFCASHIKNQLSTAAINVKRLPKTDEAHAAPKSARAGKAIAFESPETRLSRTSHRT